MLFMDKIHLTVMWINTIKLFTQQHLHVCIMKVIQTNLPIVVCCYNLIIIIKRLYMHEKALTQLDLEFVLQLSSFDDRCSE